MVEFAGPELAMWELSHGLEWVAATGLVATLIAPQMAFWGLSALVFVALSFGIVLLLSVAAATARLAIDTTFVLLAMHHYLRGSGGLSALFMRLRS